MTLDFADDLTANKDIIFVRNDKYRAYNLLKNQHIFIDNPGISLDIAAMVQQGLDDDQIESMIVKYLVDFGCNLSRARIASDRGNISIHYDFGGAHV